VHRQAGGITCRVLLGGTERCGTADPVGARKGRHAVAGEIPACMSASLRPPPPASSRCVCRVLPGCALDLCLPYGVATVVVCERVCLASRGNNCNLQCWTLRASLCGRQQTKLCCGRPAQAYKFERMQPLSYYASAEQRAATAYGGLFWRGDPEQESLAARCRMLRYTYNITCRRSQCHNPID